MNPIKGVVIGMGVLILAGFIVIAVTLVMRTQGTGEPKQAYRASVGIPNGTEIVDSTSDGDRIFLRLKAGDGSSWLMVIDARTGEEKGRINLVPEIP